MQHARCSRSCCIGTCRATPKMMQQHHASLPTQAYARYLAEIMHDSRWNSLAQWHCAMLCDVYLSRRLLSFSKRNYFFAVIALVNAVGLAEVGPALWRSFE